MVDMPLVWVKLYVLRPKSPSAPPKGIIKNVSFAKDSKDSDAGSNQSTPRSSKTGKGTRGQAGESSARTLLEQAIAAAQDPKLKEALTQQVAQLKREEAQHQQPKAAELKERRLAEELAEATIVKQQAARALAAAEGVVPKPEGKADDKCGKPFELVYDHTLFDNLDELECEDSEKETLRKIHSELQSAKTTLNGKADEVTMMLKNAQDMRQAIKDRSMKKRRTAEGQAAPPAAPQPGEAAPAASGGSGSGSQAAAAAAPQAPEGAAAGAAPADVHAERVRAETAKLSAAKFQSQQHLSEDPTPASS
ncbi:unnamed protein product [Prorocentrum cordatum]|uniref:Uncharacterized protein n=1 Tax=Prorocentrum cordatum TaxID=2364126 RepID=A0ABN9SGC8_9DINO|nr:unnamed protein product [Polarella glacialis]